MAAVRNERPTVPANAPDVAPPARRPVLKSVSFWKNERPLRATQALAGVVEHSSRATYLSLSWGFTSASRRGAAARRDFYAKSAAPPAVGVAAEADCAWPAYLRSKRVLDVTLASLALIFLSPLLLLIALAILVEGRGRERILFHQMRVGRNGHSFRFYKFRSMVPGAEALLCDLTAHNEACGPIFKMRRDPRVTCVGRWLRKSSMDELPQLFNVLKGEMSLVGPRPHLPSEVESYTAKQRRRLCVQPGLLCLREVGGRSHLSFEQWIESDLAYIEHRSLATDLGILLRALPAVFKGDGAY